MPVEMQKSEMREKSAFPRLTELICPSFSYKERDFVLCGWENLHCDVPLSLWSEQETVTCGHHVHASLTSSNCVSLRRLFRYSWLQSSISHCVWVNAIEAAYTAFQFALIVFCFLLTKAWLCWIVENPKPNSSEEMLKDFTFIGWRKSFFPSIIKT